LRGYDDPQNREFLVSVMAGRIPKELINEAKGGEVHVNMEDHKEEEFKKPKVTSISTLLNHD
jgi:UBX domain-containing protein 1